MQYSRSVDQLFAKKTIQYHRHGYASRLKMPIKHLVIWATCLLSLPINSYAQKLKPQSSQTPGSTIAQNNDSDAAQAPLPVKKLSIPKIEASVSPRNDEIHDTINNAIDVLQDPTKAMANFPRDRRFQVDWVETLNQGLIEPRADLQGNLEMLTMDMDILMKNTQFMPWVKFPHIAHTQWLACKNCHPDIFIAQEGANPITMNKVLRGEYCGVCHDKVAFSLFICERCHSVPHKDSGPKWW